MANLRRDAKETGRNIQFLVNKVVGEHYEETAVEPVDKFPAVTKALVKRSVDSAFNEMFETFWSAGMRKAGKKAARKSFERVIGSVVSDKWGFVDYLVKDIKTRIANNQMGFSELHPATYLNGERWRDEHKVSVQTQTKPHGQKTDSTRDLTLEEELTDKSWAN